MGSFVISGQAKTSAHNMHVEKVIPIQKGSMVCEPSGAIILQLNSGNSGAGTMRFSEFTWLSYLQSAIGPNKSFDVKLI